MHELNHQFDRIYTHLASNVDVYILGYLALALFLCAVLFSISPFRASFLDNAFTFREWVFFVWIGSNVAVSIWALDAEVLRWVLIALRVSISLATTAVLVGVARKLYTMFTYRYLIDKPLLFEGRYDLEHDEGDDSPS